MISIKNLKSFFVQRFERVKMVRLENSVEFSVMWKAYAPRLLTLAYMKSASRMQGKLRLAWNFTVYLRKMLKNNSPTYTVKFLKAGQLAISRSAAGKPMTTLSEVEPGYIFPRLTNRGLPKFIGSSDRRAIAGGNKDVLRFWLTLFSLYRILLIPGTLKLKTIVDPFNGDSLVTKTASEWFSKNTGKTLKRFLPPADLLRTTSWELIEKSSATAKISWTAAIADVRYLATSHSDLVAEMMAYARLTGLKGWYDWFANIGGAVMSTRWVRQASNHDPHPSHRNFEEPSARIPGIPGILSPGRLSTKVEAAGKIRVFAMVDWWTQMLLRPLHLVLFEILKKLPNDGTFNQDAAVARAVVKSQQYGCCYGFDLSAATDRLPLSLQVSILASIFRGLGIQDANATRAAEHWANVLVKRDYFLPESEGVESQTLRYSVGQPMGALSSWAMLAITHHMIVQLSAKEVVHYEGWYDRYEVLGDDIVIFDHLVAHRYLAYMTSFGVEVNVSKSVISPTGSTIEFAKRIVVDKVDVSPLSWKMVFSQDHFSGRVAIALWYLKRHFEHPQRILALATGMVHGKAVSLGTSALALLTAISGKRGITLESLLMGLIDEKGKLLPGQKVIRPDVHDGIRVPTLMFIRKLKEFFKTQKPVSMWFSEHWVREEAVESLEVEVKKQLNRELANTVIQLLDESYVRKSLIKICTKLWPRNEDNIILFRCIQSFVEEVVWTKICSIMSDYQNSINDLYTLKGMDGLFQPKYLKMMSLEKLIGIKQRIEGVRALLEIHSREVSQKVPIPNSLKIIKLILKAATGPKVEVKPLLGNPKLYQKKTILDPNSDFDKWLSDEALTDKK